jgi:hypothetical protein
MMWLHLISRRFLVAEFCLLSFYVLWSPPYVFAQILDKREHVEVVKGTRLCSNTIMELEKGTIDPGRIF